MGMRSILSLKSQGMCWQGKMHLGTLEVSLRDFDEELCLGSSRVCEDWLMIRLQDYQKWAADHFPLFHIHLEFSPSTYPLFRFIIGFPWSTEDLLISKVSSPIVINSLHNVSSDFNLRTHNGLLSSMHIPYRYIPAE